jgi:putative heme-binding domain-containing protein
MGPDLVGLWASGMSDATVFATIRSGVPGSVMPSSTAPDDELWAVVTYLKSLGTVPPWNTGAGDASRGAEIFASTCARCHKLNGTGGRTGPDLSRLALTRSRESVVAAIRDPGASVDAAYRSVTVERRDGGGDRVRGIVKNEDSFSIQMMDMDERLQGYLKSVVEVTEDAGSLMPAFGPERISDQDIDHLLAHFVSIAETGSGSR